MGIITDKILDFLDFTYHPYKVVYGYIPKEYSRNSVNVAINRLKRKGFIQKGIMEDEICYRLTKLGEERQKQKKNKEKLINIKNTKWDKIWRVVIFDIPEENKRIRHILRETLKILGFRPLQKSVWISKNNCTNELKKQIKKLKLNQFVLVFETKNLGLSK